MLTPANFDFVAGLGLTPEHPGSTHLEEPRGLARGRGVLVRPRSTQEVSRLLAGCTAAGVAVVPHGGGTGLVGGQLTDAFHPVILSMARMTATRAVDPMAGTLMIEAGATLAAAQDAARGVGRLFPLSLASEGTATVGGVLATNAGGVQVLRYGNARDLCLGVEAVMADGTVHHGLTGLRKDNTGYDLRHLLIGAEGTLGVITAACLRLFPRPAARWTFFGVVRGPDAALSLLSQLQDATGGLLTAFELISGQGPRFVAQTHPHQRQPFNPVPDWMVLVEAGAGPGQDLERLLEPSLACAFDNGLLRDGLVAQSDTQRAEFWSLRETIPDANRRIGAIASHDISLPLGSLGDFIAAVPDQLSAIADVRINCFGHAGDGNLHYNLFPAEGRAKTDYAQTREALIECVHEAVAARGGSISAEHGIGRFKQADLARYGDTAKLVAMGRIKVALDPRGILNPGAVLAKP